MTFSSFEIDFKRSYNLLLIILNLFEDFEVTIKDNLIISNIKTSRLATIT